MNRNISAFVALSTLLKFLRAAVSYRGLLPLLPSFPDEWGDLASPQLFKRIRSDVYQATRYKNIAFPHSIWNHFVLFHIDYRVLNIQFPVFSDLIANYNPSISMFRINPYYLASFAVQHHFSNIVEFSQALGFKHHTTLLRLLLGLFKIPYWRHLKLMLNHGLDFDKMFLLGFESPELLEKVKQLEDMASGAVLNFDYLESKRVIPFVYKHFSGAV